MRNFAAPRDWELGGLDFTPTTLDHYCSPGVTLMSPECGSGEVDKAPKLLIYWFMPRVAT
ncbi:hypothetical protein GGTG_06984 [Gaeumannomyces tritici R3-111a-1]|uniref:Uncharacterized protein n=1 Tax=Gaeumannomyces tritici (strain R3-111a-1) TaxID=644352 RepID=J3P0D7_GAET3|nr:hypothetical protein GGTG_06984 [Gaeumannomyces tritici R3-111a-1]EJT77070.1 hypothetical protein GGTG_06984 [Gaeumannomyces tritici R3-111a-1]